MYFAYIILFMQYMSTLGMNARQNARLRREDHCCVLEHKAENSMNALQPGLASPISPASTASP